MQALDTTPRVSILVPAYNYGHTLRDALESIRAQTYRNFEIIVLDDASTDDTPAVLEEYRVDPQIRILRNSMNLGLVQNLDLGIQAARGELICCLSADDLMAPEFLAKSLAFRDAHPQIDVSYTAARFFTDDGRVEGMLTLVPATYVGGRNEFADLLAHGCYMFFGSILAPRELYRRYGSFSRDVNAANDLELVLRWAAAGVTFAYLDQELIGFRKHEQQLSGEKYFATGEAVHELIQLIQQYVVPEHYEKIRGHEYAIIRHIEQKRAATQQLGYRDDGTLEKACSRTISQLQNIRRLNAAQARRPRISLIITDHGHAAEALSQTLAALAGQSEQSFETILVTSQPQYGVSYQIRRMIVSEHLPLGARLNAGIRIASGDLFLFFEPGTIVAPNYVAALADIFTQYPELDVGITQPVYALCPADGNERNALPNLEDCLNDLLVAPVIPQDCLAVRIGVFDAHERFSDGATIFPEWDLLLRFRTQAATMLLSHLQVRLPDEAAYDPAREPERVAWRECIYTLYPSTEPQLVAGRARYAATKPVTRAERRNWSL